MASLFTLDTNAAADVGYCGGAVGLGLWGPGRVLRGVVRLYEVACGVIMLAAEVVS